MTLDELLVHTRDLLRDREKPYLWNDEVVVGYLNEAQELVARRTHSFIPSRREVSLSAGESTYSLDEDVVFVYSAQIEGLAGRLQPATDGWTPTDTIQSTPTRYVLDTETGAIRFYATPDDVYTVLLRVARLPAILTTGNLGAMVELKRQYHLTLADWAAYRCFTHDDADGRNDGAAEKAEMRFHKAVNEHKRDTYRLQTGHTMRVAGQRVK